jgi:FlaA1/EpsC-like NDP-sugar epimerase
MRTLLPASRSPLRWRLSLLDAVCAAVAPIVALVVRDAALLEDVGDTSLYWALSFVISVLTFPMFRLHAQLPEHFAVSDALAIGKATACATVLTFATLFLLTRLEGVPRSTLVIHALLLGGGLILARLAARRSDEEIRQGLQKLNGEAEHLLIIGSNRLASMYIRMLDACTPRQARVLAVLDHRTELVGRSIAGVPIAGLPQELGAILDEFMVSPSTACSWLKPRSGWTRMRSDPFVGHVKKMR